MRVPKDSASTATRSPSTVIPVIVTVRPWGKRSATVACIFFRLERSWRPPSGQCPSPRIQSVLSGDRRAAALSEFTRKTQQPGRRAQRRGAVRRRRRERREQSATPRGRSRRSPRAVTRRGRASALFKMGNAINALAFPAPNPKYSYDMLQGRSDVVQFEAKPGYKTFALDVTYLLLRCCW